MTSGQLIDALKEGKSLIRQSPLFPSDTLELTLEEGTLFIYGWGSALGTPEQRLIHIIKHPEEWKIK